MSKTETVDEVIPDLDDNDTIDGEDKVHHHGNLFQIATGQVTVALCGAKRRPLIHPDKYPCCPECNQLVREKGNDCKAYNGS